MIAWQHTMRPVRWQPGWLIEHRFSGLNVKVRTLVRWLIALEGQGGRENSARLPVPAIMSLRRRPLGPSGCENGSRCGTLVKSRRRGIREAKIINAPASTCRAGRSRRRQRGHGCPRNVPYSAMAESVSAPQSCEPTRSACGWRRPLPGNVEIVRHRHLFIIRGAVRVRERDAVGLASDRSGITGSAATSGQRPWLRLPSDFGAPGRIVRLDRCRASVFVHPP